jgi:hypothetical protein
MKLLEIRYERVDWEYEGIQLDADRYYVEMRSPLATHEFTIFVNHRTKEISGDVVRYGSWDDLMSEEILEILKVLEAEGELRTPYMLGYSLKEE